MLVFHKKAFTLIELMVAVIIIGMIAAMGIPSYQLLIERRDEKNMGLQLMAFNGAVKIYETKHGDFQFGNLSNLDQINAAFGTNFMAQSNYGYTCQTVNSAVLYTCRITNSKYSWNMHTEGHWRDGQPHCGSGSNCPQCKYACPYYDS